MHTRKEHLRIAAEDLSPFLNEGTDKVEEKLRRLIMAHASEWTQFRSALGRESFINRWLDTLQ
jgi:hypothetical protein